jgi:hypothetical protein
MHNHTHLVLHVNLSENKKLSDLDILKRWSKVRKLDGICAKYLNLETRLELSESELSHIFNLAKRLRDRLCNISWFMSLLNQYIARKANKEDECTGRFWEGRFKSQALLTEKAILACMVYVDLNPIRAGVTANIEDSAFTSICRRLKKASKISNAKLLPLKLESSLTAESFLSNIILETYVTHLNLMIDKIISPTKQTIKFGVVDFSAEWVQRTLNFEKKFSYAAGSKLALTAFKTLIRADLPNQAPNAGYC